MLTFRRTQKNFTFITGYLWLLALPMLLGIGGLFALSVYNHGVVVELETGQPERHGGGDGRQDARPPRTADVRRGHGGPADPSVLLDRGQAGVSRAVGQHGGLDPPGDPDLSCRFERLFFSGSKEADQAWSQCQGQCAIQSLVQGALEARTFYWTPAYQDILTGDYIHPGPSSDGWPAAG